MGLIDHGGVASRGQMPEHKAAGWETPIWDVYQKVCSLERIVQLCERAGSDDLSTTLRCGARNGKELIVCLAFTVRS
jgi:hypothetical protein